MERMLNIWRTISFSLLCIRRYCGVCPYTTLYKPADITMGDFWGIENILPEFNDGKGSSVVVTHSSKALELLFKIDGLVLAEVNARDSVKRQPNAFAPRPVPTARNLFWQDYHRRGFAYTMSRYFQYTPYERLKRLLKYTLFKVGLYPRPF